MLTVPKVSLLRLQPTTGCNLNCTYCYIPADHRRQKRLMSWEVLEGTIDRLVQEDLLEDALVISWHGAEPLMPGVDWYREAFDRVAVRLRHVDVRHVFQTNGVLIDDNWCELFKTSNASVGISMDGAGLLSAPRVNWAGRPAEPLVRRGMHLLNLHDIPWTLLSVITVESMRAPRAYTDFVSSTGCRSLGFKVEESNVAHISALTGLSEVEQLYGEFVQHVWNEFPEGGAIWVREFAEYRRGRRRPNRRAIPVTVTPLRNLTVGVDGGFTIFSGELLFGGDPRFVFGNVAEGPILNSLSSEQFRDVAPEVLAGIRICASTCALYRHCGGFYLSQKLTENGTFASGETLACRLEVKVMHAALDAMHKDAPEPVYSPSQLIMDTPNT